jgi:hypothetical protein
MTSTTTDATTDVLVGQSLPPEQAGGEHDRGGRVSRANSRPGSNRSESSLRATLSSGSSMYVPSPLLCTAVVTRALVRLTGCRCSQGGGGHESKSERRK